MRTDLRDIREFFTAVAEHTCDARTITSKDEQGTTIDNTFMGFACTCGQEFYIPLASVKAIQKPMRPYLTSRAQRAETAVRLTREPQKLLVEMRNSGGWAQPDPGVVMMTAMAAAMGPSGNPMEERLNEMLKGGEKPS